MSSSLQDDRRQHQHRDAARDWRTSEASRPRGDPPMSARAVGVQLRRHSPKGRQLMVQLTERASTELRRLLTDHFARPQQGVRLRLNQAGGLAMTIDVPHSGDAIISRNNMLVLIVDWMMDVRLDFREMWYYILLV